MNTMVLTRPTDRHRCLLRLPATPAAAAAARHRVRAALVAWRPPVDPDIAILLTSDLVTNAIMHGDGETLTLAIRRSRAHLRIDVYDQSRSLPLGMDEPADAHAGRGLVLVTVLSAEWGSFRTPAGKAMYFTLAFPPDRLPADDGVIAGD